MIVALIILFLVVIINFIIAILFFSNIVLNIEEADIYGTNIKDVSIEKSKINLQLYLFKKIKILNIKIFQNYFEVFGRKIFFEKLYKFQDKAEIYSKIYEFIILIKDNYKQINFKNLKPVIKKFNMNLSLSTENAIVTSAITVSISTFISMILKKFIEKYSEEKYYYKINPKFINTNSFTINLSSDISFSTIKLLIFAYEFKKVINVTNELFEEKQNRILSAINRNIEVLKILNKVREINKRERVNDLKY